MYRVEAFDFGRDKVVAFFWCETAQEAQRKANEYVDLYQGDRYEVSYEQHTQGFNRYGRV